MPLELAHCLKSYLLVSVLIDMQPGLLRELGLHPKSVKVFLSTRHCEGSLEARTARTFNTEALVQGVFITSI